VRASTSPRPTIRTLSHPKTIGIPCIRGDPRPGPARARGKLASAGAWSVAAGSFGDPASPRPARSTVAGEPRRSVYVSGSAPRAARTAAQRPISSRARPVVRHRSSDTRNRGASCLRVAVFLSR
jgi:hypothetical protein